jgi:carbamate kinase
VSAPRRVFITLGGNAILPARGAGTFEEQCAITRTTMQPIAALIRDGVQVVLSHGNGPIVGNILIRNEAAREQIPPMPLDVCGADSQGGIGYMMQQLLDNELRRIGLGGPRSRSDPSTRRSGRACSRARRGGRSWRTPAAATGASSHRRGRSR